MSPLRHLVQSAGGVVGWAGGAGGVLSDRGHKSGPVPSRSPVGCGAQIDLLIDQQLGREAATRGQWEGPCPPVSLTMTDCAIKQDLDDGAGRRLETNRS